MNLERLVRSASRSEEYCSYILDAIGLIDYTGVDMEALWDRAAESDQTVQQFIESEYQYLRRE